MKHLSTTLNWVRISSLLWHKQLIFFKMINLLWHKPINGSLRNYPFNFFSSIFQPPAPGNSFQPLNTLTIALISGVAILGGVTFGFFVLFLRLLRKSRLLTAASSGVWNPSFNWVWLLFLVFLDSSENLVGCFVTLITMFYIHITCFRYLLTSIPHFLGLSIAKKNLKH